MVRVNVIDPAKLADQHLIAEYNEILMLIGYVRQHPSIENVPSSYRLGTGHISFFKDKLTYLKKRHELLKKEMKKRKFETNKELDIAGFSSNHLNDWKASPKDKQLIVQRITEKVRQKPDYYRYYGEYKEPEFFVKLMEG